MLQTSEDNLSRSLNHGRRTSAALAEALISRPGALFSVKSA
jgi:hypothetical protein